MGYTHYWYREKKIRPEDLMPIVDDFQKLVSPLEGMDVKLGDGMGKGKPVISYTEVLFNGLVNCGHPKNHEVVIPWPSKKAVGVGDSATAVCGNWFAGVELESRCCDGDCSYESFSFPIVIKDQEPLDKVSYYSLNGPVYNEPSIIGKYFGCCKTAFRPYDIAVTAFLIIAKRYLGDKLIVRSDGELPHWQDAMWLCQVELGYGVEFKLDNS